LLKMFRYCFQFLFKANINNFIPMKNISDGFYIGIDSGGTKCELLITDSNKKVLFNKVYKGVHYSVAGAELYSSTIAGFIKNSLRSVQLNLKNCIAIGIGAAGAREEKDRINLRKVFEKKLNYKNILVTSDAMTALYGAFEGEEGIILISGTGSVLYGFSGRDVTRVGGWGRIFGDEGSGYWLGKRTLNLVTKEFDERENSDAILLRKLKEKFGITKLNINEKVFKGEFRIQDIAPIVIELANGKCRLCKRVVNEAVEGLLEHIKTFLRVTKRKKKIRIAFVGSIIENKNLLSKKLKREIKKLKIVEVVPKKYSSAYGAILLAAETGGQQKN
jgi:N-acetylglucosamine kinase-like BadF-type ATPase